MKKTAVVYDKWLSALGGGEVVACNLALILKDLNYEVIFITGKPVSLDLIKTTLNIDMTGITFLEVWNDEVKLKQIISDKDLFINASFIDYTYPYAKKNIYYAHFPTRQWRTFAGMVFNRWILPLAPRFVKPVEFMNIHVDSFSLNGRIGYLIKEPLKVAFSYLIPRTQYDIEFSFYLEKFNKGDLEHIHFEIQNATVINQTVKIDHHNNVLHVQCTITPKDATVYLLTSFTNSSHVFLINPRISSNFFFDALQNKIRHRINNRLRAGIFENIVNKLKKYDVVVAHSQYVKKWIESYWDIVPQVIYPPVNLNQIKIKANQKKNYICSVGRFFTLGHGKKQEILIEAFKQFHSTHKNWELHLVGGVGNEESSLKFVDYLRKEAQGYPIFFHFNAKKEEVVDVLQKSKIYWHATGYGESELKDPIIFEHFGIAPIEAINSGCIPVLYNGGGLREIIEILGLNKNLHLFSTVTELVDNTQKLINNSSEIDFHELNEKVMKNFSPDAFEKKFKNILNFKNGK